MCTCPSIERVILMGSPVLGIAGSLFRGLFVLGLSEPRLFWSSLSIPLCFFLCLAFTTQLTPSPHSELVVEFFFPFSIAASLRTRQLQEKRRQVSS